MDLNEAAVFVKVVQAGSFSEAGRQLALPTSTVSTRVARLEKRLGVTLLSRTTRRLHLTEAGELYYRHASAGLAQMLDAEAAVTEALDEPKGLLRVTAAADFGDTILRNILHLMRSRCPKVRIDMVLTDRYVDLVAEGIDVAIRTGNLKDSSLIAKSVGHACWVPFASPAYLASALPLESPPQLRQHCCLQFTALGKESWTLSNAQETVTVPLPGQVLINDIGVIHAMALDGEGVALLPIHLCRSDRETGKLARVLTQWRGKSDPVHIVYPRQPFVPAKLRLFVDVAAKELRKWLADE